MGLQLALLRTFPSQCAALGPILPITERILQWPSLGRDQFPVPGMDIKNKFTSSILPSLLNADDDGKEDHC